MKKPGPVGLAELARKHRYKPGEFLIKRLSMDTRKLMAWCKDLDRGLVPDDLAHLDITQATALVRKEATYLARREREILDYFYPRMRSTEAAVEVSGKIGLLDLLKANAERDPG